MINCEIIKSKIDLYCMDGLSDFDKRQFEVHLKQCESCQLIIKKFLKTIDLAKSLTPEPTIDYSESLKKKINEELIKFKPKNRFYKAFKIAALLILTLFGVTTVSLLVKSFFQNSSLLAHLEPTWKIENFKTAQGASIYTPIIHNDYIIGVQGDHDNTKLTAVDGQTGAILWQNPISVIGSLTANETKVCAITENSSATSIQLSMFDLKTGKLLWNYNNIPEGTFPISPISLTDSVVLWNFGPNLFKLDAHTGHEVWYLNSHKNKVIHRSILHDDKVYFISNSTLTCLGLQKDQVWEKELGNHSSKSLQQAFMKASDNQLVVSYRTMTGLGVLECRDPENGQVKWRKENILCNYLDTYQGIAYVRSQSIRAYKIETGELLWSYRALGCSPFIVQEKSLFVMNNDGGGKIVEINRYNGKEFNSLQLFNSCSGINLNGPIGVICDNEGILHGFRTSGYTTNYKKS